MVFRFHLFLVVLLGVWFSLRSAPTHATEPVDAVVRAHLAVQRLRLVDNGDNDGFADPNETVQIYVTLRNGSGSDRQGIVVRMGSSDPTVGCIPTPIVSFGSLAAGEVREGTSPLVLRVADVARLDPFQDLAMTLEFVISGDDFDTTTYSQERTLDVDLNVSGGFLPTTYTEGFEGTGFGSFTTQTLDVGHESLAASDGFRCQYNDPDFVNSNSYGETKCFLGAPTHGPFWYHVDVRCSTLPACQASTVVEVPLHVELLAFPYTIRFDSPTVLSWGTQVVLDAIRGDLGALRSSGGNFAGTVESCLVNDRAGDRLIDSFVPGPGEAKYYLVRKARDYPEPWCSDGAWSTGSPAEVPGAGGDRDEDLALDPLACLP